MAKIHRMNEHLTNMIAAGEVVERPVGIVKECVENSIDANATRIEIRITHGGIEQIEIIDDGYGMDKEDALMAFERHATSKIKDTDDLWSIKTMGFRGEALPSIASVSKVEMRTNNGDNSTRVLIDYGEVKEVAPYGCNRGTEIIVRNLFQKTPARLKHLKTPQYEAALISDVVQKFALSYPNISFRLVVDGKETFKTTGKNQLKEVMYQVYSKEVFENSVEINKDNFDAKCTGLIVLPHINRATRNYVSLFINGRMIRSFKLAKAVIDAYSESMPNSRYPIAVIHITLDEQLVDVNVHPSKWEVRLSKEQQLFLLINEAVKEGLSKYHMAPEVKEIQSSMIMEQKELFITTIKEKEEDYVVEEPKKEATFDINKEINKKTADEEIIDEINLDVTLPVINDKVEVKKRQHFLQLQPLAQLNRKYILATNGDGLVIIDQHAAQERVNYEKIRKHFEENSSENTELLIPISIEVSASIMARLEEINNIFKDIKIEFESFSNHSLIVRNVPIWLSDFDEIAFIQDCLDTVEEDNNISKTGLNKDKLATKACHRSIRFNRSLTMEEMRKVIDDLEYCDQPYHCPHGRPTMITISEKQLIKEFKR